MHKIQWCSKLLCPTHYCILHNNVSTLDFNLYNNIPIFASQGLRFGSPFSPPLADLEYTRAMPPGGLSKLRPLDSRHRQRPVNKNLFVINLIWKHLLASEDAHYNDLLYLA
jgi:hypothetical protein